MTADKPKKKKSALRRNLDLLLVFLIFTPVYYGHALTQPVSPFLPREESFAPYERHYKLSLHFPFVMSYFLLTPENYQPDKFSYPLVVMLHGVSRHMYGGRVLVRPEARAAFPVFVLIPIAPFGLTWAQPKFTLRPQSIGAAMDVTRSVIRKYSIDRDRIYLTGYSMGGLGAYGALTRYHDVFAAAVPISGTWDAAKTDRFDDIPVWIVHGRRDATIPVQGARGVANAMTEQARDVYYTEYPSVGHDAWVPLYENPEFWTWLLDQRKP